MPGIAEDFLGEKELPDTAYSRVQTLRGKDSFHITGIPMSAEPYFVKAFGYVKKAAALANRDLGVLDARVANMLPVACCMAGFFQQLAPRRVEDAFTRIELARQTFRGTGHAFSCGFNARRRSIVPRSGPVVTVKPRRRARRCMRTLPSSVSPRNSPMPRLRQ